ncbi:MAG: tRNA pseudouridine(55) synthase TruB [Bacilli bacterium]|nr:tRNA pseudouridine(55) synthase TruB [Bacilli bacterium]
MNYLVLVNKENKIKNHYFKTLELQDTFDVLEEKIQVEKKTLTSYIKLKKFLKDQGVVIAIDSSYRSLEEQRAIINKFEVKYGSEYAKKYVAPIKSSEHHTGLAIDLSIQVNGKFLIENNELMTHEDIFLKIHPYLHNFGFILRYPKGKEKITGYFYEPWHIRYVGVIPATIMYQNNLTLEEYLTSYSGVLVVNKEKNMTSRDVVNQVSHLLGIKKIGHTGTLDPIAEGVLVLTIGKATKLGEILTAYSKEYISSVEIGKLTDTLDITGKVLKEKECHKKINYRKLLESFHKTYMQEVPIYSAVKVKGKKLYEYAREGIDIELPKKEVTIKEIELLDKDEKSFKFRCLVSKGTYIRSLIRDMGQSIDEYFSMSELVRTQQGKFSISNAYTIEQIRSNQFQILSIKEALAEYPSLVVELDLEKKVKNGCRISNDYGIGNKVVIKNNHDKILAIYQAEKSELKPYKML